METKKILETLPKEIKRKWDSLAVEGSSDPMEKTTLSLLREITRLDLWNYFFRDLPIDASLNIAMQSLDIARMLGSEDVSGVIGKIEKESVNLAVKYLEEYLFKNQIKTSFGAMEVKYKTSLGSVDSPFQYIMVYKPIDETRGKLTVRIYSPKKIIPPASRGSYGMAVGFLNNLNPGQKISPFIAEISGEMRRTDLNAYVWIGTPTITTVFPGSVPDFGLKPRTWQDKYIINPIKNGIKGISDFIGIFINTKGELIEYVVKDNGDQGKIDEEIEQISSDTPVEDQYPEKKEEPKKEKLPVVIEKKKQEPKAEEVKKEESKIEEKQEPIICIKSDFSVAEKTIIINEVAWMGSSVSSNDEWIELRNISNRDINIKGWRLVDKGEQINITFGDISIPKDGYLLLERTDDSTVPSKPADLIYQGALSNKEEELYLFNASCQIQDFVQANLEWPAGNNEQKMTMERGDGLSWQTSSTVGGTPKEKNGVPLSVNKENETVTTITATTTALALSSSPKSEPISGGGPPSEPTYCSASGSSSRDSIIINEVAWMGTSLSSNDEWVELKNISGSEVNLNGWQLLDESHQIKVIFTSSDIIAPGGYYLLERTDDDSVSGVTADKIYTGALSDTNESLRIFNPSCQMIDDAVASPDWAAGDKDDRKTMERGNDLSWHTYYGSSADVTSGLWGTPRVANSTEPPGGGGEIDDSTHLLITEVQGNGVGGNEYVELFNQGTAAVNLCPSDDNCHYLSYFPSTFTDSIPNHDWDNPGNNWKMPNVEIAAGSYYLIDIYGDNGGDWMVTDGDGLHYSSSRLSNTAGALAIFSNNPVYSGDDKTAEERISRASGLKVDAVAWKDGGDDPAVKETQAFVGPDAGKVIGRKWIGGRYKDTNNNSTNFQSETASPDGHVPQPPEAISSLAVTVNPDQENSVILSWTIPSDPDTPGADLLYKVYYSLGTAINPDSLNDINDYVSVSIGSSGESGKTVVIPDLYYDSHYYFVVKAYDPAANYSPISNQVDRSIGAAVHQRPAPYGDFRRSNHFDSAGPTDATISAAVVLAQGSDGNSGNDDFSFPVMIDKNGTVYFRATIDGVQAIYSYDMNGRKWSYSCIEVCEDPSIGADGTVYFSDPHHVYALSPSKKLRWRHDFAGVSTTNIILDSLGRAYVIASEVAGDPILFAIDRTGTKTPIYHIVDSLGGAIPNNISDLVIDEGDNIYFSVRDLTIKAAFGGKIAEKHFPTVYDNPETVHTRDAMAGQPYLASSGLVLIAVSNGACDFGGNYNSAFYNVDSDLSDIAWNNNDTALVGVNNEEFYYINTYGMMSIVWEVTSVNISDGTAKWLKKWTSSGSIRFSPVSSDSGNNLYFVAGGEVLGYDSTSVSDNDNSHDRILSFAGGDSNVVAPLSFGQGKMYIPHVGKITFVTY